MKQAFSQFQQEEQMRYLITGATGCVGSYLADILRGQGRDVVAIAREQSDTAFLRHIGVAIHTGDFRDVSLLREILLDVDAVIHCAGKIGDGTRAEYQTWNVSGLGNLLNACKGQGVSQVILLSSLGIYGGGHHHGTTEDAPVARRFRDAWLESMAKGEQLAWEYYREFEIPLTVFRIGCVYGPRDRHFIPWLLKGLRENLLYYPGGNGQRTFHTIYVGNLVQAILLALERVDSIGKVFNLTDGDYISKRTFVEALAEGMDLPAPTQSKSLWFAEYKALWRDRLHRLIGSNEKPYMSRSKIRLLGYHLDFSIDRAKLELGYLPRFPFSDAMFLTTNWFKQHDVAMEVRP